MADAGSSPTEPQRPILNWIANADVLWEHRRMLAKVGVAALLLSAAVAFCIPKRYESVARLMPPEPLGSGSAMLAAIAGRSSEGLAGLGGLSSLLGGRSSGALFIDLLRSRTISDRVIDRFDLQRVYHTRYRVDAVKYLARHTDIVDDKKSGVITLTFTDTDPRRAQQIAQAYVEELNHLSTLSNVSSARQEREFIAKRLVAVQAELEDAEKALSDFSSVHTTLDVKEQTRAMVDSASRLRAEVIVGRSELDSLRQIYGDDNVRVRAARARLGELERNLTQLSGTSTPLPAASTDVPDGDGTMLYPSLRQLPRLAVPYENLYRTVRIQEAVFELLSQQYEMARIEEAKDTPVVSVIDPPLVAEKKSFPPRMLLMLTLTMLSVGSEALLVLCKARWSQIDRADPRCILAAKVAASTKAFIHRPKREA